MKEIQRARLFEFSDLFILFSLFPFISKIHISFILNPNNMGPIALFPFLILVSENDF
jgi:hypothetical protein